jgi:hypothetical protein
MPEILLHCKKNRRTIMSQENRTMSNIIELSHDELNGVVGGVAPTRFDQVPSLYEAADGKSFILNSATPEKVQSFNKITLKTFGKPTLAGTPAPGY